MELGCATPYILHNFDAYLGYYNMNYYKSQKRDAYTSQVSKEWTLELFKSPFVYARKCFGVPWHSHLFIVKEMTPSSIQRLDSYTHVIEKE